VPPCRAKFNTLLYGKRGSAINRIWKIWLKRIEPTEKVLWKLKNRV